MSFRAFVIAFLAAFAALIVWHNAGKVEGYLFPVATRVELSNPRPGNVEFRSLWDGKAEKLRDCSFVRLRWYLGPRDGPRVRVRSRFEDAPEIRPAGEMVWTELFIGLPADTVLGNSHAFVYHDCGWPWETQTLFFDSEKL